MDERVVDAVAQALFSADEQHSDRWGWDQHPPRAWEEIEECERAAYRRDARAAIGAYTAALADAGIVLVPREPTLEMIEAGRDLMPGEPPEDYYAAMIAAAPDQR